MEYIIEKIEINKDDSKPEENLKIFKINKLIEQEIKIKCGIPNWGEMIFGLLNLPLRKKLLEITKINKGYHYFILGVQQEYGIDTEINFEKAFEFYQLAAKLKETYALHKLYNIFCYQNKEFKVERDREKELFYLFQAISYSDASLFIHNDTFFKIDINYEISLIFDLEESENQKFKNLLSRVKYLEDDENELRFVESIINSKFLSDYIDIKLNLENLKDLADNLNHIDS